MLAAQRGHDRRGQPLGRHARRRQRRTAIGQQRERDVEQHLDRERPGHRQHRLLTARHQVLEQAVVQRVVPALRDARARDHDERGQRDPVQGVDAHHAAQRVRREGPAAARPVTSRSMNGLPIT